MDFFAAQADARRRSRWLVLWFVLGVMSIIALIYLVSIVVPHVWRDPELGSNVLAFGIVPLVLLLLYRAWREGIGFGFVFMVMASSFLVFCLVALMSESATFWVYPEWRVKALALWVCAIIALAACYTIYVSVYELISSNIDYAGSGILLSFAFIVLTVFYFYHDQSAEIEQQVFSLWDGRRLLWVCLFIGGGIAAASLFKIWQISRYGGRLIAEQLGGRIIMRDTYNTQERRLLNVIDEMSIAAGIPAPVAYVLTYESSLNAFAAGMTTKDCVIGVTQGLLNTMSRDEMQGVIAHEVAHIVNGDSRLNLKMIGALYGINALTLMGQGLMRMRGATAVFGYAVCVIGFIGVFFGRIIQAAVSRQREYLADASAAQFTRNPAGLVSALRKLRDGGSEIESPQAIAASHLFLGASDIPSAFRAFLFDTHPSLTDRILRLGGIMLDQPDEKARPPVAAFAEENNIPVLVGNPHAAMPDISPAAMATAATAATIAATAAATSTAAAVGQPEEISPESLQAQILLAEIPVVLRQSAYGFGGATGLLAGLLFSRQSDIREQQEKMLPSGGARVVAQNLYQWLNEQPEQGARYRLVWLDLILPTLREALPAERQQVITLTKDLIRADGQVNPTEFALYSLLRGALLSPSDQQVKRSELRLEQLDKDISDVLALLAYSGHADADEAEAAYQAAIACSPAQTQHSIPAKSELSLNKISDALAHLALAAPLYRKKLLEACAVAVQHDSKITPVENELLCAFAQSLDCPAPLTASGSGTA
ncbi:MAG: M48 family metallopeptidase [Betaproteobacteria bacterium]|nr:M48 family metallopeptidase [Betaproteobacteria bacterium]